MTDLEQRIREAYDAQHASEALRGRTLALLEEERKRRPDAPSVEVHRASLRRRPRARVVTAWAACLLLALALVGAYGVYRAPSAFVDIEVNPSLELTVNTFGIVIEAEALNDDGAVVLGAVDMLRKMRLLMSTWFLRTIAWGRALLLKATRRCPLHPVNMLVAVPIAPLAMRQLQRVWALVAIRLPKS